MPNPIGIVIPKRVAFRAISHSSIAPDGCHVSRYSTASHGYAQIGWRDDGRQARVTAHRAAWTWAYGQVPADMTVDHVCRNKRCVNPLHLRLLSNFENARRAFGDWPLGQCKHGHSNEHLTTRGKKRTCRLCAAEWQRRYRARRAN